MIFLDTQRRRFADELVEIFLKLSMKTVHLIIWATLFDTV